MGRRLWAHNLPVDLGHRHKGTVGAVRCGNRGRTKDLSSFDREHLTDDKLHDQLPPLALGLAEQLTGDKYDA